MNTPKHIVFRGYVPPDGGTGLDFGQKLERLRALRKMSRDELARRAGTSTPTVEACERGRGSPFLDTAVAFADALSVPPAWMLFEVVTRCPSWLRDTSAAGFGLRLRTLRAIRGCKQEDLARAAHVTPMTISRLEAGANLPDLDTIECLARCLLAPQALLALWIYPDPQARADAELRAVIQAIEGRGDEG